MDFSILRRAALVLLGAGLAASAFSQDLIARQAPVDRRLRAVDSVAIQRAVERDLGTMGSEIYTSWVTNRAHPYKTGKVPNS